MCVNTHPTDKIVLVVLSFPRFDWQL